MTNQAILTAALKDWYSLYGCYAKLNKRRTKFYIRKTGSKRFPKGSYSKGLFIFAGFSKSRALFIGTPNGGIYLADKKSIKVV